MTDGTSATEKRPAPWYRRWWVIAIAVVLVIGALSTPGDESEPEAAAAPEPTTTVTTEAPAESTTSSEATTTTGAPDPSTTQATTTTSTEAPASTTTTIAEPQLTRSEENAIGSAESYLAYASFSREGLIGQLEYEGFTTAEATFAVDYLDVDWNEQAVGSADAYLGSPIPV